MSYSARNFAGSLAVLAIATLAFVSPVRAADDEEGGHHKGFIVSFAEAKTKAAEGNKDIFMEFTGSDWCPPCKQLYKSVLSTETFLKQAPEKFVLLMLDNPRDKSHQSQEEIAEVQELIGEYNIEGFPTIILADAKGRPYAKMVGFGGGGPEDYLKNLEEKFAIRIKRDEMMAKAEQAEGAEKAKFLGEALKEIDPTLAVTVYREQIDQIIELDADNATGMKDTFASLIKSTEAKAELNKIMRTLQSPDDIKGALPKLDELAKSAEGTPAIQQEILMMKAQLLFNTDKEASKEVLMQAQKIDPESEFGQRITQILEQFFGDDEAKDK